MMLLLQQFHQPRDFSAKSPIASGAVVRRIRTAGMLRTAGDIMRCERRSALPWHERREKHVVGVQRFGSQARAQARGGRGRSRVKPIHNPIHLQRKIWSLRRAWILGHGRFAGLLHVRLDRGVFPAEHGRDAAPVASSAKTQEGQKNCEHDDDCDCNGKSGDQSCLWLVRGRSERAATQPSRRLRLRSAGRRDRR